ncbi:hypothetical protein IQ260_26145 [Leptolyngbya cf. ectocarpi LEGE 11479]|uniref:Uncharacterized protein n=1 Tax=Leptolyngbya cf. ectocarpi LEGE 11479 TaxID=1828722 RepID=A0A928ZZA7_LEPEC|nr:hypothetical protein [Leptolyngbya ectocarpi]MBE9070128.1 hypothetical protein [Leptolyngbya cf. ectocarpi LEGE 11479]
MVQAPVGQTVSEQAPSSSTENDLYNELHSEIKPFLDILRPLIRQPSVVGTEDAFFRVLERELEEFGINFQGQRVQAHLPYVGTYLGQGEISRSYSAVR